MLPCVCVTMYVSVKERRGMCVNGQMSVLLLCVRVHVCVCVHEHMCECLCLPVSI